MAHRRKGVVTQMFISPPELLGKGSKWSNNTEPCDVDERKVQNLKRSIPYTDRAAKSLRTSQTQPENVLRITSLNQDNEKYKDRYTVILTLLDLDGDVDLVRKKGLHKYYTVRQLYKDRADEILPQLREIRHENIMAAIESFTEGEKIYIVFEKMTISLDQIVRSCTTPTAYEIGTMMGQILDGLVYLQNKALVHGTLNCNNVLINKKGNVKLASHKPFVKVSLEAITKDMREIAKISMMLMQTYALDGGKVGVEKVENWKHSHIVDFLSSTTSSNGAAGLRKHQFLSEIWSKNSRWENEKLGDLVRRTDLTVPRNYRYRKDSRADALYSSP